MAVGTENNTLGNFCGYGLGRVALGNHTADLFVLFTYMMKLKNCGISLAASCAWVGKKVLIYKFTGQYPCVFRVFHYILHMTFFVFGVPVFSHLRSTLSAVRLPSGCKAASQTELFDILFFTTH